MFKKKQKIKAEFVFGIIAGTNVLSTKPVYITWKRGKKKENAGQIKKVTPDVNGNVKFDSEIKFLVGFEQDPKTNKYTEKIIQFTMLEALGLKNNAIGILTVNLADYAENGTLETKIFPMKKKDNDKENGPSLMLKIKTDWKKMDGKNLIVADSKNTKNKEPVHIGTTDYILQTTDEITASEDKSEAGDDVDTSDVTFPPDSPENFSFKRTDSKKNLDTDEKSDKSDKKDKKEKKEHVHHKRESGSASDEKSDKSDKKEKKEKKIIITNERVALLI